MKPSLEQILLEEQKRKQALSVFDLSSYLFKEQLDFVLDPEPFKVGLCSRRAGKSTACAADLVHTAVSFHGCTALYVTGARSDAKKIVWSEVKRFNDLHKFGGIPNESELCMTFPNTSVVRLAGAKDEASIDKIRGQLPPVKKAYIDEAQSIKNSLLKKLVDDVLEPALMDFDGSLIMIGTPPPVPNGYFVEASKSDKWSVHKWTFFNNPFISLKSGRTHQQMLERVLKRRGVTVNDPSIRREFFGELEQDTDSLVYHYDAKINHFETIPPAKYTYILGVDLGFNDADALCVLAWSDSSASTYLVEELVTRHQGITELVEQIEALKKKYDIAKIVVDQGGLGKKIAEELSRRYKIGVEAAEKVRKVEFIELMNDALRTGRLKAKSDSHFAFDASQVQWDREKSTPDKKVISDRFHSDICEAVLYAWRYSYSFTYTVPKEKPAYGTPEWATEEAQELERQAEEHFQSLEEAAKAFGGDFEGY